MLTVLDRYLLREVVLGFCATVVVLLAMVLSYRLARYLSQAASGLLTQESIWLLLALQSVRYLVLLIPLATLLAIMLTLGRLYRDSEMTALQACGFRPRDLYRPLLFFALPLSLLMV
ncbi:MAG: LptF/LptG family permease, partial [Candidatus Competibacterales bacterium]|nr:LptF/LptG family permease [Candidatus Competibacterales bacterium]